jgi:GTP cyclohydrolase I
VTHDGGHSHHATERDDELEPELTPDRPRHVTNEDRLRYEGYLAEILAAMGLDLDTPGTRSTPRRFLRALFDTTSGYEGDPKLLTAFPTECRGGANCEIAQVVEGPIPFFALCEHHALPFFGDVYMGYVAHEGIIGISKLTRLVRVITRRFGVQERMTYQICDELDRMMEPHGVAVYVEAHHLCTQMRGVREMHPKTRTTSYRGVYVDSPQLRGEFFDVGGLRRGAS